MSQDRGKPDRLSEHEDKSEVVERGRHHLPPAPDPGPRPEPVLGITPGLWPPPFPNGQASPVPLAAYDVTVSIANGPPQSAVRITGYNRGAPDMVSRVVGTGIVDRGNQVVISMKNRGDSFLVELADSVQPVANEVPLSTRERF